jgi:hypothetical protein
VSKLCCDALAKEVREHRAFAGGGLYDGTLREPTGQIEQLEDGTWAVNGCCGGGCFVLEGLKFCPFCGAALPSKEVS